MVQEGRSCPNHCTHNCDTHNNQSTILVLAQLLRRPFGRQFCCCWLESGNTAHDDCNDINHRPLRDTGKLTVTYMRLFSTQMTFKSNYTQAQYRCDAYPKPVHQAVCMQATGFMQPHCRQHNFTKTQISSNEHRIVTVSARASRYKTWSGMWLCDTPVGQRT